jgi:MYXO-CTERM domain-containing protein
MLGKTLLAITLTGLVAGSFHFTAPNEAEACGCFVPPDPTVPIVQAGERILFGMQNGIVTSHVQVQYSGAAEEFGWLLPMPSIPEMELGTDELFAQLIAQTQPTYRLDKEYRGDCPFDPFRNGGFGSGGPSNDSAGETNPPPGGGSPLVLRDSIGPYDYAVLRADAKQPMLDWLSENGFFVPAGTDDVVGPYIQPGAYFLALKLLKGNDVGDLQPVVLKYQSDLPMIPIILTSVAADPNMGVQVWVLGDDRAIPRNYHHTKINDAALDWVNAGQNYVEVVTDAVDEIDGHHSFVTEYAGPSNIMVDILDYQGRFGNVAELAAQTEALGFITQINNSGFALFNNNGPNGFSPTYPSQVLNILQSHLPVPKALLDDGITAADYYWNFSYYIGNYRETNPEKFLDLDLDFSSAEVAQELDERVVAPTLAAGQMFRDHDYLSRLFTTLSPNEMTKDPVFSFNPDLPEVSNVHSGKITYYCQLLANPTVETTPAVLYTEQGFKLVYSTGTGESDAVNPYTQVSMPQSQYQEVLREEGDAEVVVDNTELIKAALADARGSQSGGCSVGGSSSAAGLWLLALGLLAIRRRRNS